MNLNTLNGTNKNTDLNRNKFNEFDFCERVRESIRKIVASILFRLSLKNNFLGKVVCAVWYLKHIGTKTPKIGE